MTPRKVHYWLKKDIIGEPVQSGRPGKPTLLSFEQLLKIRTVQHLRDNLSFSLQKITPAILTLSTFVFIVVSARSGTSSGLLERRKDALG